MMRDGVLMSTEVSVYLVLRRHQHNSLVAKVGWRRKKIIMS